MAEITAASVKELRERTGAGMMDCKKALAENNGEMETSVDWLRSKGLAAAAKKAGRTAAEGLVGVAVEGKKGALVEVNSETDFVAKNEQFQQFVGEVSKIVLASGDDVEALKSASFPGGGTVEEKLTDNIATIGENQSLRRAAVLQVGQGVVVSYVHNAAAPNMGKIGVLVALESAAPADALTALGKQLAMHIAAANPLALDAEGLDPAVIERERAIAMEKASDSGKPANIIEKMVEGRLRKFYEEVVLLKQAFVINPDLTVEAALKAAEAEIGAPAKITGFVRFALGDGVEKEESDFAAEVAAAAKG